MRIAILDPAAGISGDMTLGALLALGVPQNWLEALPGRLGFEGVAVTVRNAVVRRGVQASRVHDPGASARTPRRRAGASGRASAGIRLGEGACRAGVPAGWGRRRPGARRRTRES